MALYCVTVTGVAVTNWACTCCNSQKITKCHIPGHNKDREHCFYMPLYCDNMESEYSCTKSYRAWKETTGGPPYCEHGWVCEVDWHNPIHTTDPGQHGFNGLMFHCYHSNIPNLYWKLVGGTRNGLNKCQKWVVNIHWVTVKYWATKSILHQVESGVDKSSSTGSG